MSDSNTVEMREFYLQFSTTITPPSTTLPKNLNSKWFSIWFFFNSWWNISSLYILWLSLLSKSIEIRVYYFNESVFVPRTEIPWGWFNSVIVYVYTTIFFSLVFSLCRSSLMFLLSSLFSICNAHTISLSIMFFIPFNTFNSLIFWRSFCLGLSNETRGEERHIEWMKEEGKENVSLIFSIKNKGRKSKIRNQD